MKIFKTILQVLLIAQFAFFGISKIIGAADMVATFNSFGAPAWFRVLTGVIEVTAVLALAYGLFGNDRATYLGALMIFGLTIGAVFCHIVLEGNTANAVPPMIVFAQTALMAWLHGRVTNTAMTQATM